MHAYRVYKVEYDDIVHTFAFQHEFRTPRAVIAP